MTVGPVGPAPLSHPSAQQPRHLFLTGFMGAGKSTVGRILAARLVWPFVDIDTVITTQQRLSVAEIFTRHGEPHYRRLETEAIAQALEQERAVIALGGGAIETEAVRRMLFSTSLPAAVTIYLEAPLDELLARCRGGAETPVRPLLAAAEPPEDRLARRLPHYRRAHLTVATGGVPPAAVVERILGWLAPETLAPSPATPPEPSAQHETAR